MSRPSDSPLLIVISGPPGTGKTTLGRRISSELRLPFVSKDDVKETLFDSLGWRDREWSKKLGFATYDLLYYFVESQLAAGRSLVVESNFRPEHATAPFVALKEKYGFTPFQVQCLTEGTVLLQRFKDRARSGVRHPGHIDRLNYEEFEAALLRGRYEPLDIGGTVFEVDTTDFEKIDYEALFQAIQSVTRASGT